MSLLITLEGTEGCGKSTQIKLLAQWLEKQERPFLLTREPGATPIGAQIRSLLLDRESSGIVPVAELLLYAADRAQHCKELIQPKLQSGKIVLCDRFYDSTTAYQEGGRGLSSSLVAQINEIATGALKPDLTFLLDLPVEIGLKRALQRAAQEKDTQDRFEKEALAFHERVRKKYHEIAKSEPQRFVVVDATQAIHAIHQEIIQKLIPRLS